MAATGECYYLVRDHTFESKQAKQKQIKRSQYYILKSVNLNKLLWGSLSFSKSRYFLNGKIEENAESDVDAVLILIPTAVLWRYTSPAPHLVSNHIRRFIPGRPAVTRRSSPPHPTPCYQYTSNMICTERKNWSSLRVTIKIWIWWSFVYTCLLADYWLTRLWMSFVSKISFLMKPQIANESFVPMVHS